MQFVQKGPDIPELLLRAHEDGRVVFFCGAGISYAAGLPSFQGLVDKIYQYAGTTPNDIEKAAYLREQYDATLDLLERRLPGHRNALRSAVPKILTPNLRRKSATIVHKALLKLARNRQGQTRLVTTNFDRIFERLKVGPKLTAAEYHAPFLPIPKNSRWDGIVYLHGLLPARADQESLNRLVLTSGDFGLAYLTERWAARFVSELFRSYVVCFVGYSINDPVLRYMMDALAADRMLGEFTPEAYALGDFQTGDEAKKGIEWRAKGVTPVLYEVPTGTQDHSLLHHTLTAWAETYRDGVQGKERIVVDYALTRPQTGTKEDDFVGRMLWALSDKSGLPAKRFAELDPVPSLDWIGPLGDSRYHQEDLPIFGVLTHPGSNKDLVFSIISRPAPHTHAPWMMLVSGGNLESRFDDAMFQLARWLARHLNDPELILWLVQRGRRLNERFMWLIEGRLDELDRLERDGKIAEISRIRDNAPNAIPQPLMRIAWRLLLTDRVKSPWPNDGLYTWKSRVARDGLTASLRLDLRKILAPKIIFKKPFRWGSEETKPSEHKYLKQLIDWEIVLTGDHIQSSMEELRTFELFQINLPTLLPDFQQLLFDALDLLHELGEADDRSDRSHWDMPSISPHWQNRGFSDWVALIELLRDAWAAVFQTDLARAADTAHVWSSSPYPTFKRLAFFAATHEGVTPNGEWVDWLLADEGWWLWSVETQREIMRLIVLQGAKLTNFFHSRLEAAILRGPPRSMFNDDLEAKKFSRISDEMVWLRLAKLNFGGGNLRHKASNRLNKFTRKYPDWHIAENERDEFSHWMTGTGDPDYEDHREFDLAPRNRKDLAGWLLRPSPEDPFYEDDWREVCKEEFSVSASALIQLAGTDQWPVKRWREALTVWSENEHLSRSWRYLAPVVNSMPDEVLRDVSRSVIWWLRAAAKSLDADEHIFINLCRRILEAQYDINSEHENPVSTAINHPIGHATEALLDFWFRRQISDDQGLPADLRPILTDLCDIKIKKYLYARVILSSRLITIFRVDQEWTSQFLLPIFNWNASANEAQAAWEGFLWAPRIFLPLLASIKSDFLETARHYSEIGEHGRQYATFLTYTALDPADVFSTFEISEAFSALPKEGREEAVQALVQALESAGEQREENWRNRIRPFWQNIWPKTQEFKSKITAEKLARIAIAARGEFPAALETFRDWLEPIEHPHFIVHRLYESGLCKQFPKDALTLLNAVISDQRWGPRDLDECLREISSAWPDAIQEPRFQRLMEYGRRQK